ncbi:TonB-dependent receptor [Idiomarina xiamenensis]|uniref:TonB-dependent receptor plug n=1 Tax=Idiomarina xiamenensis 10-D-4 TaxID=740709 RepID=K2KHF0_9GAMM|nr:TonB-dependent receptor [Idiomarina xiamenensis]EKE82094.1 TonB-dependent receptor plug [Idiomarina xiamenensis 10-D-4]
MTNTSFKVTLASLAVAASLSVATPAFAQQPSNILGQVVAQDTQGLTVEAYNAETGFSREISVNDGRFRFPAMPTGVYELRVKRGSEVVATQSVRVSLGSNATPTIRVEQQSAMETIQVTGARVSNVDVTTTDSGLVVGEVELDKLPVGRDLTSVALLAPGTVRGDDGFGDAASFGGASIAENSCYINGLEVTDTRQGLGCGSVPFEFYKEFQVKTGGMSPKYGRATGGVINAVTKSGTNAWEFSAVSYFEPSGLREDGEISRGNDGVGNVFRDNSVSDSEEYSVSLTASGPIIKDKLFIYALVNPRSVEKHYAEVSSGTDAQFLADSVYREEKADGGDNLFWGAKIDWDISPEHRLSYFGYSDERTTSRDIYRFDANTSSIGDYVGQSLIERGGTAHSLSYTGYWSDSLTVSALAGRIETQYGSQPSDLDCPSVSDAREVDDLAQGCGPGGSYGENSDENTQYRLDLEYYIGDHTLRAGYDYQERESVNITAPAGGHNWTYKTLGTGATIQGDVYTNTTGAPLDYVEDRIFEGGGSFSSELSAFYIEDAWQITDRVLLNIGIRKDKFEGTATNGNLLYSFNTDIAPRLGISWDVFGTGDTKIYATWGEYYLPIANNTIYRSGSGISDTTTYYTFDSIDPTTGEPIGFSPIAGSVEDSTVTNSIATPPPKDTFQAQEADPFAREEFILGFEQSINEDLALSVRGTYREVTSALDDYCGRYAYPYCILLNPGEDSSWYKDGYYWNGSEFDESKLPLNDGVRDEGSLTMHPNDTTIQLPKANNEYLAVQTELKYRIENFRLNFLYTWSRSTGNFEGAVKSDIDQADPGVTQDFDFPALMDGAYGYQPNDRRHVFKVFGSYDINDNWTVGFNGSLSSGRPISAFGQGYPSDDPNIYGSYGDTFYIADCDDATDTCTYTQVPRGTAGRTPWTFNVDASVAYNFSVSGVDMKASLDVFNIFNTQEATAVNEHYESSEGVRNQYYKAAYSWQTPRYVRLGFEARF